MTPSRKPDSILVDGKAVALLPPRQLSGRVRPYVGYFIRTGKLTIFHSDVLPTEETHGDRFKFAIGPFDTEAGARLMIKCVEYRLPSVTIEDCEHFVRVRAPDGMGCQP